MKLFLTNVEIMTHLNEHLALDFTLAIITKKVNNESSQLFNSIFFNCINF